MNTSRHWQALDSGQFRGSAWAGVTKQWGSSNVPCVVGNSENRQPHAQNADTLLKLSSLTWKQKS